jgi:beta-glucosidase-like glycosyl hydrolase
VGQLFIVCLDRRAQIMDAMRAHRGNYYGGVFLNRGHLEDPERARRLTFRFRRHSREIPPPFVAIDEEGGLVTNIGHITAPAPSPAALAAVDDEAVTRDVYLGIGEKVRALGFNTVFAPCLDVNVESANPVIGTRSFGASPEIVIKHGAAAAAGLREAGVLTCMKHFPGHGATSLDSHFTLPVVEADRNTLDDRELEPFRHLAAQDAPPEMVMTAHVAYPALQRGGVPATLSPSVLQGVLRRELGYRGLVVTDSMEMKGITGRYGPEKAAVEAILAGADLLLYALDPDMAKAAYEAVQEAVRSGKISEERLNLSVDRAIRIRNPFRNLPWISDEEAEEILDMRHDQAFFQSALDGIVLEGNAGVLAEIPESAGPKIIVLPRRLDEHRELPLGVVREQLEPEGFTVLDVGPKPGAEEIGRLEVQAATASVIVVGTATRGRMTEESQRLVAALTRRDVIKVGVALLDPGDADHMMTTNCRMKTFGFSGTQLWGMCQKLAG